MAPARTSVPNGGPRTAAGRGGARASGLTLAALGVVFGDIGTSPLYALQTVFSINHGAVRPTAVDVYGVISLLFWSLTLIIAVKYLTFILRADNEREGGIMALTALVQRATGRRSARAAWLVALGIVGASLFYGDGVITPAISVLSAVDGLKVTTPSLGSLVVPITVAILVVLFAGQRWGTHRVGRLFGPVMAAWFVVLAAAGIRGIAAHPEVAKGLSPTYAASFTLERPGTAFVAMGAVVLAITGAEALYADMGHFGPGSIRRAWFVLVFPALTLNYLGQAALILHDPATISSPFFLLMPGWARMPTVFLATAATVIASQAVISGAFSLSHQAVQLGFLPRLTIRHTSEEEIGEVYAPAVNWLLFAAVLAVVVGFGSATRLASAYGVAVTGTFVIDTILFLAVARLLWHWRTRHLVLAGAVFLSVEAAFFAANATKIAHGAWLTLLIALGVFTILRTWQRGHEVVTARRSAVEGPLAELIAGLHAGRPRVTRVPGTAVFLSPSKHTAPLAMRELIEHAEVLHESVVIVSAHIERVPHVPASGRVRVDDLGHGDDGITHVTAHFGFQDAQDIPQALREAVAAGLECQVDLQNVSYFLSRIRLQVGAAHGMGRWRKRLFVALARNAASPIEYFRLPDDRTVVIGSTIAL